MIKILLSILFCLLTCFQALAKEQQTQSSIQVPSYKESVLTPEMELMNLYGNYPVNLSTGLVDISIPLYEIKTPGLSLPINIKFHPSGLKADEQEGLMGLRWLLDANYSVNRKVKGYPDDDYMNYGVSFPFDHRVNNPNYTPDLSTLYGTYFKPWRSSSFAIPQHILHQLSEYQGPASQYMDTEYDIFSYQLPSGKSGKFILKDSAGIKIPCTLPYEPIQIEVKRSSGTGGKFNQIIITDENGITYNYGKTIHLPVAKENIEVPTCDHFLAPVGWYLNAIISADKQDTILFEYNNYLPVRTRCRTSSTWSINDDFNYSGSINNDDTDAHDFITSEFSTEPSIGYTDHFCGDSERFNNLASITFKGGKITFNHSSLFGSYFLSSMIVSDASSVPVKRINFSYRREGTLVLLDKLSTVDTNTQQSAGAYTFQYFDGTLYPENNEVQSDWWGYFLPEGSNVLHEQNVRAVIPQFGGGYSSIVRNMTIGDGIGKNSSLTAMRTGMIKSIKYPTGGQTNYDYETNYFYNQGQKEACGGLRVKTVENVAANGTSEVKTYSYNPQNNGCGTMPNHLYPARPVAGKDKNFFTETLTNAYYEYQIDGVYSTRTFSNSIPGQFFDFHSNIVTYNNVVEYQGTTGTNAGYTKYTYFHTYPDETEYIHQVGEFSHTSMNKNRQFTHILPPRYGESSHLQKKSIFNAGGQPVHETLYEYTPFDKGSTYDLPVKRYKYYKIGGHGLTQTRIDDLETFLVDANVLAHYGYINQQYILGAFRLTKETIHEYTTQGQVTSVKDIQYDPWHLLPVKETVSTSVNNETLSTTYKYPYQYSYQPYTGMTRANILSPVIEKGLYRNQNLLEKAITNYAQWFTNVYAPINFQYQKQGYNTETRLEYQYNNQSQLKAATKDAARKVVYIRDAYAQPLAVIDQASYSEVETALGATFINQLATKFVPSASDLTTLNGLRTRLPNAQVTTYKYKPLIGVTEITDPSGKTVYYDYDSLGRLKETYIRNGNAKEILESYEYNYVNK